MSLRLFATNTGTARRTRVETSLPAFAQATRPPDVERATSAPTALYGWVGSQSPGYTPSQSRSFAIGVTGVATTAHARTTTIVGP